jgi:hypothetical protein
MIPATRLCSLVARDGGRHRGSDRHPAAAGRRRSEGAATAEAPVHARREQLGPDALRTVIRDSDSGVCSTQGFARMVKADGLPKRLAETP